jgi:ankyrin repeat protein
MYFPAVGGYPEIADILHSAGSDVNASSPGGMTALHGAVIFHQQAMVKWLLEHGAEPGAQDGNGKTALDLAEEQGDVGIAALLQEFGAAAGQVENVDI